LAERHVGRPVGQQLPEDPVRVDAADGELAFEKAKAGAAKQPAAG